MIHVSTVMPAAATRQGTIATTCQTSVATPSSTTETGAISARRIGRTEEVPARRAPAPPGRSRPSCWRSGQQPDRDRQRHERDEERDEEPPNQRPPARFQSATTGTAACRRRPGVRSSASPTVPPPPNGVASAAVSADQPRTGRVFRRSAGQPPVAVEAHGSTIRDADGREYLDAAGGAIVVNIGHGRAGDRPRDGRPGRPPRVCPRQRVHHQPLEAYARESARGCRWTTRRSSGVRWLGGDRELAQARPRLPPRPRRARPLDRHRPLGLPRQLAGRARPVGSPAAPPPVRGLAGPVPARLGGLPVSRRRARAEALGTADELAAELERAIEGPVRTRSRRSSPNRSSERRSRPRSRPTTTGRASSTSAGATACCSSPTRS